MSSTPGRIGQVTLLSSRSLLLVIILAWILLGCLLLEFPSNSYAADSSMRPQTPSRKLQSEMIATKMHNKIFLVCVVKIS